eukprot:1462456-Amphidinium_carterae.2
MLRIDVLKESKESPKLAMWSRVSTPLSASKRRRPSGRRAETKSCRKGNSGMASAPYWVVSAMMSQDFDLSL